MRQLLSAPIARKMKTLRKRNKLSQTQMGEIIGLSQSTYAKYEKGYFSFTCCQICQICAWFKINPSYFFEDIFTNL